LGKLKEGEHLEDLDVDERIVLNGSFKIENGMV
jgi:hypothetical protein